MNNIDKVYYINLDSRTDRNDHITKELDKMGIDNEKIIRVRGIIHQLGYVGCGLSHISIIKDAIEKGYNNIIIFEDDFEFTVDKDTFNKKLEWFFQNISSYNITLLSYYLNTSSKINEHLIDIIDAQTTSGYMLNKKFMATLMNSFYSGVFGLINGMPRLTHCIDMHWKSLQGNNREFFGFWPKLGRQMGSWSDIEKRYTDYNC